MWRRRTTLVMLVVIVGALIAVGCLYRGYLAGVMPSAAADPADITLPAGFRIDLFAADVPNARQMALGPAGIVFVGSRSAGMVYAVVDRDGDQRADAVYVVARGLQQPSGLAYRGGTLYVAEISRVVRFRDVARDLTRPPSAEVVTSAYPTDGHHGWKFIAFGPDGRLYVPVGAPCNVCMPPGPLHATITRLDLVGGPDTAPDTPARQRPGAPEALLGTPGADNLGTGGRPEIVARGVRNSVGFDFHPTTGELWFTDNGRDWMGDEQPPDELNRLSRAGEHFGFPHCHGAGLVDPEHGRARSCDEFTPPAHALGAHVAALGMRFYTGRMFPEKFRGGIFIAEHGSWNRSTPVGYRVTFVTLDGPRATSYEPFATGWLQGTTARGRPADVLVMPDGALLVSDDKAGRIYRISYAGN